MRETRFIQQNKDKWAEFENMLKKRKPDVDKIYNLFFSISDDLAFARTHYPNRSVRVYLNNLTRNLFKNVYAGKRFTTRSAFQFWKEDLPAALYATRFEQATALLVFLVAALIGVVSCLNDDNFAASILGEGYVRMTLENISSGKPMAVYDEQEPFTMFLKIAGNNLKVCFMGFTMGIIGGLGTLYVLLYNGIMVGTFQFFFAKHNLLWDSFLTIWMHGALEISSIVIGAGAGFTIGKGVLFPGTYSRLQSLLLASRRAIIIMIGLTPVIVVAAFIESFLTRYYDLPMPVKLTLILASFGFMIFYFGVYPLVKGKKVVEEKMQSDGLTYLQTPPYEPSKIYNAGQISGFTLQYFGFILGKTIFMILGAGLLYVGSMMAFRYFVEESTIAEAGTDLLDITFLFGKSWQLMVVHVTGVSALVLFTLYWLKRKLQSEHQPILVRPFLKASLFPVLLTTGAYSFLFVGELMYGLVYVLVLPLFYVLQGMSFSSQSRFLALVSKSWTCTWAAPVKIMTAFFIFMILGGASIQLLNSQLMYRAFELVFWNFSLEEGFETELAMVYLPVFIGYVAMLITFQLLAISSAFLSGSLIESNEAPDLLQRLQSLRKE